MKQKLQNYLMAILLTGMVSNAQITGPSSSATPYLLNSTSGSTITSLLTAGDAIGGYKFSGIPDGTGAFDNGDGNFTVLINHELANTVGAVRAHGTKGAFVSKWIVRKSDLTVLSGSDLIQSVYAWNVTTSSYELATTTFNRFCSADLPATSAFYNSVTGLGTQEKIFLNGEESGTEGRAFGHIVTGTDAGKSYELPLLGKYSWENAVANPNTNNKTIVAGTDDTTPGQVYMYIGTKTNTGTEIEKAGLTNGKLWGVAVTGYTTESSTVLPATNAPFTLVDLGNVSGITGATLDTNSTTANVTRFLRPEDGAWNPVNKNIFYFATTNSFTAPSRLWKLTFTDINNPELGGTINAILDGTEGQKSLDNLTVSNDGTKLFLQEDVGNQAHIGKIWVYDIATDALSLVAEHDSTRFVTGGANFLTQDEESSGIIDVSSILGANTFLFVDQAHYTTGISTDVVEGGQLLTIKINNYTLSNPSTKFENSISLYPNPANNEARIQFSSVENADISISIYDTLGKLILKSESNVINQGNSEIAINTQNLNNGLYFLKVTSGNNEANLKLIVKH